MKIALLLTGQLRTNKLCRHLIKNILIDKYDTDVFMSIDGNNLLQTETMNSKSATSIEDIRDAIAFFNPVDSFVSYDYTEEYNKIIPFIDEIIEKKFVKISTLKLTYQQYYIVDKAYKMLQTHIDKTGIHYDLVIRLRFDQYIWSEATSSILPTLIKQPNTYNILYTPENIELMKEITKNFKIELDTDVSNQVHVFGYGMCSHYPYVNDQFFTHSHDLILTISKFYEEMTSIINTCGVTVYPTNGCVPEHFWHMFLKNHGLTVALSKVLGIFIREFY